MTFDDWKKTAATAWQEKEDAMREAWEAATLHEREACADLCERMHGYETTGYEYATAIRKRGTAPTPDSHQIPHQPVGKKSNEA